MNYLDLKLSLISKFLQDEYSNTEILVGIVEDSDPYYVIGLSTGTTPAKKVLIDNPSLPCDGDDDDRLCTAERVSILKLALSSDENSSDIVDDKSGGSVSGRPAKRARPA